MHEMKDKMILRIMAQEITKIRVVVEKIWQKEF
jgi:hypothetical protein